MRILFQARFDLLSRPGGDTIQLLKTREHLHRLGVDSHLDSNPDADLAEYDLVHLFNITHTEDTYLQLLNAKRQKKKIALSTIYWNRNEVEKNNTSLGVDYREPLRCKLRRVRRSLLIGLGLAGKEKTVRYRKRSLFYKLGYYRQAREILNGADILLPNSVMEKNRVLRDFSLPPSKHFHIVLNGIEPEASSFPCTSDKNSFFQAHGIRDFILSVGRIEKRKNQCLLLDALRDHSLPMVFIGRGYDRGYCRKVKTLLRPSDRIINHWPHDKIRDVYALARVHVLPSFYETPGLASLEAGSLGLNVVVGNRGSEVEYFGGHAEYCDPGNKESIRGAVERSLEKRFPNQDLTQHIRENFTWEKSAGQTLEAYRKALSVQSPPILCGASVSWPTTIP